MVNASQFYWIITKVVFDRMPGIGGGFEAANVRPIGDSEVPIKGPDEIGSEACSVRPAAEGFHSGYHAGTARATQGPFGSYPTGYRSGTSEGPQGSYHHSRSGSIQSSFGPTGAYHRKHA